VAKAVAGAEGRAIREFAVYPDRMSELPRLLQQNFDVVMIDLDSDQNCALQLVQDIAALGTVNVIVYSQRNDPTLAMISSQAGANDFLPIPGDPMEDAHPAPQPIAERPAPSRPMDVRPEARFTENAPYPQSSNGNGNLRPQQPEIPRSNGQPQNYNPQNVPSVRATAPAPVRIPEPPQRAAIPPAPAARVIPEQRPIPRPAPSSAPSVTPSPVQTQIPAPPRPPVQRPIQSPAQSAVPRSIPNPVQAPPQNAVQSPIQAPVQSAVPAPVQRPVQRPVAPPVQPPVAAQLAPAPSPVSAPPAAASVPATPDEPTPAAGSIQSDADVLALFNYGKGKEVARRDLDLDQDKLPSSGSQKWIIIGAVAVVVLAVAVFAVMRMSSHPKVPSPAAQSAPQIESQPVDSNASVPVGTTASGTVPAAIQPNAQPLAKPSPTGIATATTDPAGQVPQAVPQARQVSSDMMDAQLAAQSRISKDIKKTSSSDDPPPPAGMPAAAMDNAAGEPSSVFGGGNKVNVVPVVSAISAGVAEGMVLRKTPPVYPKIAKDSHVSGTVVLGGTINRSGILENIHVISGPQMLRSAATDAVKTWRYRPYLLNNQPVAVQTTISVVFTLGKD
jgi:protein TonB